MKIDIQDGRLRISQVPDLRAHTAGAFLAAASRALPDRVHTIEIDLSNTATVDSGGVGALVALYTKAARRNGAVVMRVLDPPPPVQHLLELTRVHRFFEVTTRNRPEAPQS